MITTALCSSCSEFAVVVTYADQRARCSRCGAFVGATDRTRLAHLLAVNAERAEFVRGVVQGRAVAAGGQEMLL